MVRLPGGGCARNSLARKCNQSGGKGWFASENDGILSTLNHTPCKGAVCRQGSSDYSAVSNLGNIGIKSSLLGLRDVAIHTAFWIATGNPHPSHNSLIKKERYAIPALGTDSILD
jgi:hypothetical protein